MSSRAFQLAAAKTGFKPYYCNPTKYGMTVFNTKGFNYPVRVNLQKAKAHKLHNSPFLKEGPIDYKESSLYPHVTLGKEEPKEITFSAFGSLIDSCLEKDDNPLTGLIKQYPTVLMTEAKVSPEMFHLRWTMGAREVARIEGMSDPIEARKQAFRLALRCKVIEFKEEDIDSGLVEELGFAEEINFE